LVRCDPVESPIAEKPTSAFLAQLAISTRRPQGAGVQYDARLGKGRSSAKGSAWDADSRKIGETGFEPATARPPAGLPLCLLRPDASPRSPSSAVWDSEDPPDYTSGTTTGTTVNRGRAPFVATTRESSSGLLSSSSALPCDLYFQSGRPRAEKEVLACRCQAGSESTSKRAWP
jgi:hypothetical protein